MMNRYNNNNNKMRESLVGGRRNIPLGNCNQRSRRHSLSGVTKDTSDDNYLDLFSKTRRSLSVASSSDDSSDVSVKLGRLSVGSVKSAKNGNDDLLTSADGGKHDYDWLLTPPGTPLFPSSDGIESLRKPVVPRTSSLTRSVSTTKASNLLVSKLESNNQSTNPSRPARSSSVTRSSISASKCSNYFSNRCTSILNTSSASVSSYIRPASPGARSVSSARSSTPSSRSTASTSSTPSRTHPSLPSSTVDKSRPSQKSRPSTPSSRQQLPSNLNSLTARASSCPTTPTHQNPITSTSPAVGSSTSAGRVISNGRSQGPASQPSSPSPRVRPRQPIVPPDFPLDTPSNIRKALPDRPVSAGRSCRGSALPAKSNPEAAGSVNIPRRHSSPMVTRGRPTEALGRGRSHSNGRSANVESQKTWHISEQSMHRPMKSTNSATDNTGFGRNISKKSMDMAISHMDIRNGAASIRQLLGTTLFPQSIGSTTSKTHSMQALESAHTIGTVQNRDISEKGNGIVKDTENGNDAHDGRYSAKFSEVDIYENSRYEAILLKEDLKNTNWLHSIDDKSDQGSIFDNGFEYVPEPFDLS